MALVVTPKKGSVKVTTCPAANHRALGTWEAFRYRLLLNEDLQWAAWWPRSLPLTHAVLCMLCEECEG